MFSFDDNKLKFQIWKKSVTFKDVKNPPEEWWPYAEVQEDMEFPYQGWDPWSRFECFLLMIISLKVLWRPKLTFDMF